MDSLSFGSLKFVYFTLQLTHDLGFFSKNISETYLLLEKESLYFRIHVTACRTPTIGKSWLVHGYVVSITTVLYRHWASLLNSSIDEVLA